MNSSKEKIRVLIAKIGLDGHEMGARLVSFALMNDGMEVIYTGPRQSPESVVAAALQEDVDVIGLSFLSGAHKEHTTSLVSMLKNKGVTNIKIVVGGIIPSSDETFLKSLGVNAVFGPGSDTRVISKTIRDMFTKT